MLYFLNIHEYCQEVVDSFPIEDDQHRNILEQYQEHNCRDQGLQESVLKLQAQQKYYTKSVRFLGAEMDILLLQYSEPLDMTLMLHYKGLDRHKYHQLIH